MSTITVQIGNSDNKLTQRLWHLYVLRVNILIEQYANMVHFSGGSSNWEPWQNYCWVIYIKLGSSREELKSELEHARKKYNQDSIAWVEGTTEFI